MRMTGQRQIKLKLVPNPICAECQFYEPFRMALRGGVTVVEETLICDDCGAAIEDSDTYFQLGYPTAENVCEDCVMRAERVRGDDTYEVTDKKPVA